MRREKIQGEGVPGIVDGGGGVGGLEEATKVTVDDGRARRKGRAALG